MRAYPTGPAYPPPPLLLLLLPNPNPLFWNTPLPLLRARCPPPARSLPAAAPTISAPCALDGRHPCAPLSLPLPTLLISAPVRNLRALLSRTLDARPMRGRPAACTPIARRSRAQFLLLPRSISAGLVLSLPHARSLPAITGSVALTLDPCSCALDRLPPYTHLIPYTHFYCSFSVSSPGGSGPNLILTLAGMHNSLSKCFYPTDVSLRPNSPTTLSLAVGASYLL
ncbi:hypothetical protein DFH08DRAFT_966945 [Mycena albidolilacea]|uniref:Uncharacterized protein n=1 Tax=Mycena albidolilacea TaxID=1033008 RepID=A0AAD6ZNI2_9AGAR|nr:hypothetical protein DFH08DRAFT_966945 [Mycena albidolilacea]